MRKCGEGLYNKRMEINWQYIDNNAVYKEFKVLYSEIPNIINTVDVITDDTDVTYLKFKIFKDINFINQGFSTRLGGVSDGIYSSMNLTYSRDDSYDNVRKNFDIIGKSLNIIPDHMVYSKQTHTTNVLKVGQKHWGMGVTKPLTYDNVDGLITNEPHVCLVTAYADCIPVIMVDPVNKVIGAAHAGWKGTVGNIVKAMINMMNSDYGTQCSDIKAFVGPGICLDCYEVSEDVATEFNSCFAVKESELILKPGKSADKYQLNLPMANVINLYRCGVKLSNIAVADICTCCNPNFLFSHRATGGKRGILCNFIEIK